MRKWVAGVAFALAITLFATAGWHRFEYRYCNARRLNLELASSGYPSQATRFFDEDRARDAKEFLQLMLGGLLFVAGVGLWTGRICPEKLQERLHAFWMEHGPHGLQHR